MNSAANWDTLDEPVWDTIARDISSIGLKLKYILLPKSETQVYMNVCKNWDLWGPFIFCTYIAFSLNNCGDECAGYHQSNFSSIFILLWIGALIIATNYKLIVNNSLNKQQPPESVENFVKQPFPMSIFQMLCLLGYCLAIPSIGLLILQILRIFTTNTSKIFFAEKLLIISIFGFFYPIFSVLKILNRNISDEKAFLVIYPIMMFFVLLSLYSYTYVWKHCIAIKLFFFNLFAIRSSETESVETQTQTHLVFGGDKVAEVTLLANTLVCDYLDAISHWSEELPAEQDVCEDSLRITFILHSILEWNNPVHLLYDSNHQHLFPLHSRYVETQLWLVSLNPVATIIITNICNTLGFKV